METFTVRRYVVALLTANFLLFLNMSYEGSLLHKHDCLGDWSQVDRVVVEESAAGLYI